MATSSKRKCAEMDLSEMGLSSAATVRGVFVGNVFPQPLVSAGLFLPLCGPKLFPAVFSICFVYVGDSHALFGREFSPAVGLALPSVFQKVTFVTACTCPSTR